MIQQRRSLKRRWFYRAEEDRPRRWQSSAFRLAPCRRALDAAVRSYCIACRQHDTNAVTARDTLLSKQRYEYTCSKKFRIDTDGSGPERNQRRGFLGASHNNDVSGFSRKNGTPICLETSINLQDTANVPLPNFRRARWESVRFVRPIGGGLRSQRLPERPRPGRARRSEKNT